jgi:hypothetical protein
MKNENSVNVTKERRDDLVSGIKNYFSKERGRNWRSGCGPDAGFHTGKISTGILQPGRL